MYFVILGYITFGLEKSSDILLTEDFKQPKILFQEIVQESQFMIDTEGSLFFHQFDKTSKRISVYFADFGNLPT